MIGLPLASPKTACARSVPTVQQTITLNTAAVQLTGRRTSCTIVWENSHVEPSPRVRRQHRTLTGRSTRVKILCLANVLLYRSRACLAAAEWKTHDRKAVRGHASGCTCGKSFGLGPMDVHGVRQWRGKTARCLQ